MTRGNQRDRDRARAQARAGASKKKDDGLTPAQRNERYARNTLRMRAWAMNHCEHILPVVEVYESACGPGPSLAEPAMPLRLHGSMPVAYTAQLGHFIARIRFVSSVAAMLFPQ